MSNCAMCLCFWLRDKLTCPPAITWFPPICHTIRSPVASSDTTSISLEAAMQIIHHSTIKMLQAISVNKNKLSLGNRKSLHVSLLLGPEWYISEGKVWLTDRSLAAIFVAGSPSQMKIDCTQCRALKLGSALLNALRCISHLLPCNKPNPLWSTSTINKMSWKPRYHTWKIFNTTSSTPVSEMLFY